MMESERRTGRLSSIPALAALKSMARLRYDKLHRLVLGSLLDSSILTITHSCWVLTYSADFGRSCWICSIEQDGSLWIRLTASIVAD